MAASKSLFPATTERPLKPIISRSDGAEPDATEFVFVGVCRCGDDNVLDLEMSTAADEVEEDFAALEVGGFGGTTGALTGVVLDFSRGVRK